MGEYVEYYITTLFSISTVVRKSLIETKSLGMQAQAAAAAVDEFE
jgi:hypothetical protein